MAPGSARPAMTAVPDGLTRTMSKLGAAGSDCTDGGPGWICTWGCTAARPMDRAGAGAGEDARHTRAADTATTGTRMAMPRRIIGLSRDPSEFMTKQ